MAEPITFEDLWVEIMKKQKDASHPGLSYLKELSRLIWNEALDNAQAVVLDLPTSSDNIEASAIKIRATTKLELLKSQ